MEEAIAKRAVEWRGYVTFELLVEVGDLGVGALRRSRRR
jgi:hypothetical protein